MRIYWCLNRLLINRLYRLNRNPPWFSWLVTCSCWMNLLFNFIDCFLSFCYRMMLPMWKHDFLGAFSLDFSLWVGTLGRYLINGVREFNSVSTGALLGYFRRVTLNAIYHSSALQIYIYSPISEGELFVYWLYWSLRFALWLGRVLVFKVEVNSPCISVDSIRSNDLYWDWARSMMSLLSCLISEVPLLLHFVINRLEIIFIINN